MDSGNMHHFVGADSSCISWGHAQSGELGYGPNGQKSSAIPKKVEILEGMHVINVACGFAHSLVIVDRTNVTDRLEQLEVYDGKAANEVIEEPESGPAVAEKPSKKSSVKKSQNSKKRKKAASSSEDEDDEDSEYDSDDSDEILNGKAEQGRGGKSSGKGRGKNTGKSASGKKGGGRGRGRPPSEKKGSETASGKGSGRRGRPKKS
ncbi:hypothetical protein CDL12_29185 [Handroanthus impetiginosus]|nr:hypothetical protein CDL12_29185 [Handroanthus impetiginosus]